MIVSFACRKTERLWQRQRDHGLPPNIERVALRKLTQVHRSRALQDLRVPPATGSKPSRATGQGGTAFGSMTNGASASAGGTKMHWMWKLWTIIERMKTKKLPPVHPGEILLHDFIEPLGLTQYALAKAIGVTPIRVSQIVRGQRSVTADTALRLSRYFGTRPGWWLDLQSHYDLERAADHLEERIARTVKRCPLLPAGEPVAA